MEAELTETLGVDVELIGGEKGVFDVVADGELLFSKHEEGRFPENAEIIAALRDRM